MDGYFQSALVANTTIPQHIRTSAPTRVPPFPPSNKEFQCTEVNTPDGIYPLLHETFNDTIAPQFASGTRASVVTHIQPILESSEDEYKSSLPTNIPNKSNSPEENNNNNNTSSSLNTSHNSSLSSLFSKTHPTSSRSTSQLSTSISRYNSKPKNHLSKTSSSFILRVNLHDHLQKLMVSNLLEGEFTFFNIGASFIWIDSNSNPREPLSRITFTKGYPTCHDINQHTQCEDHVDVIIGFSTGDIIWYEPLSCKYVRMNKGGSMISSAVTMIKWMPGSEDLFIAIFKDGSVMVMDKERDDQPFHIPDPSSWVESEFLALKPHRNSKNNPVSYWKMSEKGLTDMCFSPDNIHMAVTGMDGKLRLIDYRNERLTDIFSSYFGKLNCVDWSPDGRYILTGGEDDLVTIWSFMEKRLIARCQGHKSWVTGVAFDRWHNDKDSYRFGSVGEDCNLILWDFSFSALQKPKNPLRTSAATAIPKPPVSVKRNASVQLPSSSLPPIPVERKRSLKNHRLFRGFSTPDASTLSSTMNGSSSFGRFKKRSSRSNAIFHQEITDVIVEDPVISPVIHPTLKRNQAAVLLPSTTQAIHADPCVSLLFRENAIVTTDRRGRIRTWSRPK